MVSFEINVGGVQVMSRELARMTGRIRDLRPVLGHIAESLAESNRSTFGSEGANSPYGRWAPLSPKYKAWKDVHFPGQPILVRTGAMRRSLVEIPLGIQTSTERSISMGTDTFYAGFHQSGTDRMPRRRPVALTEQHRRDMMKTLQRYIVHGTF